MGGAKGTGGPHGAGVPTALYPDAQRPANYPGATRPGQGKGFGKKKKKKMRFDENIFQMGWGRPGGMMLMIMIASIA